MPANSLEDLLVQGLQEIYYTEQQLVDALQELESQSTDDEVKQAFAEHREETQGHVDRVEEVFEMMDQEPQAKETNAVKGLIQDHEEFTQQDPDENVLERFNIAAGQKTEHLEIAAYGNVIPIADELGMDEAADILEQNLREEQDALEELSQVGEEFDYGRIGNE